jgi:hypothetical protein
VPASVTTTQPGLALEASPANLYDLVAGAVHTSAGMPKRITFVSELLLTAKKTGDRRKQPSRFSSSRGS